MSLVRLAILLWFLVLPGCALVPSGAVDERYDPDGDGVPWPEDCDDTDPDVATESTFYADADGDGHGDPAVTTSACTAPQGYVPVGDDCDDSDADAFPGGTEVCDGADNDCNGTPDDVDDPPSWYLDADGDGYGREGTAVEQCARPTDAYAAEAGDCDDADPTVNPGASEVCNGFDDDCDDLVDDDDDTTPVDAPTWYLDADGDGYGDPLVSVEACIAPADHVATGGDCDDDDPAFHPGAPEDDCDDPADYNCDGSVGFEDADDDGFSACDECDDGDATVYPGADEYCDGVDNDCDGVTDEPDALDAATWYPDGDGDGFGAEGEAVDACDRPPGHVADGTDCDDVLAAVHPGADEVCNDRDDDCDDLVDDDDGDPVGAPLWYPDTDGDGWGDPDAGIMACTQPQDHLATAGDCDDDAAAVHPGAPETDCSDPTDYNCDGSVGHTDADGDGWEACEECYDADDAIHPDADEICDGVDNDCDAEIDESDAVDAGTWYFDADGDGFGDPDVSTTDCSRPDGYVADGTDCNDDAFEVNPGQGNCGQVDVDLGDAVALSGPAGTRFGFSVAGAGDLSGDGLGDVLIGAPSAPPSSQGAVWVLPGPLAVDATVPGAEIAVARGESQADEAGGSLVGVPDLGDDGVADWLVGAPSAGPGASPKGSVYLLAGGATGTVSLGEAEAERGAEATGDEAGASLGVLADVDGDGLPEILVGAPGHSSVDTEAGAAYVLRPPLSGNASLSVATTRLLGEVLGDRAGAAVADAGDLSGDGSPWLAVGAPGHDGGAAEGGAVYIVSGGTAGQVGLASADALLLGPTDGGTAGASVAAVGDADGDGFGELAIGAPGEDAVYLVQGPVAGTVDLSGAHAVLTGEAAGDEAGAALAAADVNGDGLLDLVVGAPAAQGGLGAVYVWTSPVASGTLALAGAPYRVTGSGTANLGAAVANAGDLDGDGRDDLLLSDWESDTVYVVLGSMFVR